METKFISGDYEPVFVSGVCIGVGTRHNGGMYRMVSNTIVPDTDEEYEKEKEEIIATAKLFSAAKEMLEALKELQDHLTNADLMEYITDGVAYKMRAAIKKATQP